LEHLCDSQNQHTIQDEKKKSEEDLLEYQLRLKNKKNKAPACIKTKFSNPNKTIENSFETTPFHSEHYSTPLAQKKNVQTRRASKKKYASVVFKNVNTAPKRQLLSLNILPRNSRRGSQRVKSKSTSNIKAKSPTDCPKKSKLYTKYLAL